MGKISEALDKSGAEKTLKPIRPVSKEQRYEKKAESPQTSPQAPKKVFKQETMGGNQYISSWDERFVEACQNYLGVSESFRRLRTKILHPTDGEKIRSILVTSAVLGEGKSFVCANLGVVLAQSVERHAIVVDCDMRRPALAGLFGLDNRQGLVDHLRDGMDLSLLIRKTGMESFSIIPAGIPPVNPSELLTSAKMTQMVDEIVDRYSDRIVIFDSPPAQAASETAVLAQHVDKVIIVVRWGVSGREEVKKFVDTIGREKILGVVFNAFEMTMLDTKLPGEGYYK
ncbi:MAG: polysaccharide biosynthesis tyrosine autokinase [Desulfobulbaceae bacterium]|nr:polysaccharide biosynthesis tyrosine autokinase [Desulfobulbaceae bacterium]